jgi:hypothetical protein
VTKQKPRPFRISSESFVPEAGLAAFAAAATRTRLPRVDARAFVEDRLGTRIITTA